MEEYSGVFNDGRKQYQINLYEELETELHTLYREFSNWISSWEL